MTDQVLDTYSERARFQDFNEGLVLPTESNPAGRFGPDTGPFLRINVGRSSAEETSPIPMHEPGAKADVGKLRPTLVIKDMSRALLAVIKIATDGAAKYTDGGWLHVPEAERRYEDADLRHMLERFTGVECDKDSQSLHLAHNAWNALAKLELHLRNKETS